MTIRTSVKSGIIIHNHAESCGPRVRSAVKSGQVWNHAESCGPRVRSSVKSGGLNLSNHAESCAPSARLTVTTADTRHAAIENATVAIAR